MHSRLEIVCFCQGVSACGVAIFLQILSPKRRKKSHKFKKLMKLRRPRKLSKVTRFRKHRK